MCKTSLCTKDYDYICFVFHKVQAIFRSDFSNRRDKIFTRGVKNLSIR